MSTRTVLRATVRPGRPVNDRGAVVVWVAIMIPVLLVMAALVIDVGSMYVERRALQNGADAAALAVAQECAHAGQGDRDGIAAQYVDLNAPGGQATCVCGIGEGLPACTGECAVALPAAVADAAGWVKVGSLNAVDFAFAPFLPIPSRNITADAIAAWGPLGGGVTLPLTFSECEYQLLGGAVGGPVPEGTVYVYFHDASHASLPEKTCNAWAGHMDVPGGFGWLSSDGTCQGNYTADGWISADPGKSQNECRSTFAGALGTVVLVPIFDQVTGTGANAQYHIAGFAGFELLGYRITGAMRSPGFSCPAGPGASAACIYGRFVPIVEAGPGFGGTDYGARAIRMVG